jgi:hypothetical protein
MPTTPERFERLLFSHIGKNHPVFNIQLAHLEKLINRARLAQNAQYKKVYRRIKKLVGSNYNTRVARGRNAYAQSSATTIQRHWRGTSVRRPKNVLVKNPNSALMYGLRQTPSILVKLHANKVRRNKLALLN